MRCSLAIGLDAFGRIVDHRWLNTNTSTDLERIEHGYDRASNRLWRQNTVGFGHDELYAYDGLHRLIDAQRGVLNAGKDAIATLEFAQEWSLDPLGNWQTFRQDEDGDSTWNLDQSRTHSDANEIETITNPWVDPAHDAAGNMTTVPQPADPTSGYTATYNAWNRLVKCVGVGGGIGLGTHRASAAPHAAPRPAAPAAAATAYALAPQAAPSDNDSRSTSASAQAPVARKRFGSGWATGGRQTGPAA